MVKPNLCRAYNVAGFDKRGYLRKMKKFEGESATSPREAARKCLEAMRAGKSRSTEITIHAGEYDGVCFSTVIGLGGGGTPHWRVPATDEGINSLPETY